jgi:hypothetical protein
MGMGVIPPILTAVKLPALSVLVTRVKSPEALHAHCMLSPASSSTMHTTVTGEVRLLGVLTALFPTSFLKAPETTSIPILEI